MCIKIYIYVYVWLCICVCVCVYVCVCVCTHVYMYVCVYIYVCVCVCVCVPGGVLHCSLTCEHSYEDSDVEVNADREQWLDVALVHPRPLVQAVEDDTESLQGAHTHTHTETHTHTHTHRETHTHTHTHRETRTHKCLVSSVPNCTHTSPRIRTL